MVESIGAEKARIKEQRDILFKALSKLYVLYDLGCYSVCIETNKCDACIATKIIEDALKEVGDVS